MLEKLNNYLDNLKQINNAIRPHLRPDMSGDEVLQKIREGSERVAILRRQNDAILQECIWDRRPESLTETEAKELKESAQALFGTGDGMDMGISYTIHRLLRRYAQCRHKRELYIEECYWQGLTLYYLQGSVEKLHCQEIHDCFQAGSDFLDVYAQLGSDEARTYVIRSVGNLKLDAPDFVGSGNPFVDYRKEEHFAAYQAPFDFAMAVAADPQYRVNGPEPSWWETFVYKMHLDMSAKLDILRDIENRCPGTHPEIAQAILHSTEYVYAYNQRRAAQTGGEISLNIRYRYLAARYHAGLGSAAELVRELLRGRDQLDRTDCSSNGIFLNVFCPLLAQRYLRHASPEEQAELGPAVEAEIRSISRYILNFNNDRFSLELGRRMQAIVHGGVLNMGYRQDGLLNLLLCSHIPTFVHSRMVSELSAIFMDELCRRNPAALVGTLGIASEAEALSRRAELVEAARSCGLYHDLGKSQCMSYVTIYGRRLLDEEFAFIELHPVLGYKILKSFPNMRAEAEVALRHHMTYDERGGYWPNTPPCPPEYKRLVDIISIADATDAATDAVGRSYAQAKTLRQLAEEFRAGSGARYSPAVAALFDSDAFLARVEGQLQALRREIYSEAYLRAMEA